MSNSTVHRLVLIGCSKTKKKLPADLTRTNWVTPQQLYGSPLFAKRVSSAVDRGLPWAVLSAKYGVWNPTTILKPYDMTLDEMNPAELVAWHVGVATQIVEQLWEPYNQKQADGPIHPRNLTIEIHAGADYCNPLTAILRAVGITVELPCEGLGIGEQLAFYTHKAVA